MEIAVSLNIKSSTNLEEFLFYEKQNVQLSFFKEWYGLDHFEINERLLENNIHVSSIHLPRTDIYEEDFINILEKAKEFYGTSIFTLHAGNTTRENAMNHLKRKNSQLNDLGAILCYENFKKQRKTWVNTPQEISELPFDNVFMTYDLSHTHDCYDCLEDLDKYFDKIKIVHFSNRYIGRNRTPKVHLPYDIGDIPTKIFFERLKEKGYEGQLVLEYLDQFEDDLINDSNYLKNFKEYNPDILKYLEQSGEDLITGPGCLKNLDQYDSEVSKYLKFMNRNTNPDYLKGQDPYYPRD